MPYAKPSMIPFLCLLFEEQNFFSFFVDVKLVHFVWKSKWWSIAFVTKFESTRVTYAAVRCSATYLGPVYLTVYFCDLGDKARRCRLNQD